MGVLKCDVCGGTLCIDQGGKTATCDFCGVKHSTQRMREKVQEIKETVNIIGEVQSRQTETVSDVQQWKQMMKKYMNVFDYKSALSIAKKILETVPSDWETNNVYELLNQLQYFDIRDGVLVKYNGRAKCINVPEGIKAIEKYAFDRVDIEELILPDSLEVINEYSFGNQFFTSSLKKVKFGNGLKYIAGGAFCGCPFLSELTIPESIHEIAENALPSKLKHIVLPKNYEKGARCLSNCECLDEIDASESFIESARTVHGNFELSPWCQKEKQKEKQKWRNSLLCQHCGGSFKGIISIRCSKCGKPKDY